MALASKVRAWFHVFLDPGYKEHLKHRCFQRKCVVLKPMFSFIQKPKRQTNNVTIENALNLFQVRFLLTCSVSFTTIHLNPIVCGLDGDCFFYSYAIIHISSFHYLKSCLKLQFDILNFVYRILYYNYFHNLPLYFSLLVLVWVEY